MSIIIDGKEYYGIIYKIENTITNEVYIGQTSDARGFNGRYGRSGTGIERVYNYWQSKLSGNSYCNKHLLYSIKKYGFNSFIVDEVFDTAENRDDLNNKEQYYIKQFDSFNNGYNYSIGGDSVGTTKKPRGKDAHRSRSICQISLDGNLIKVWDCILDAVKALNITQAHIIEVCKNKRKTAGGFVWVYTEDYDKNKDYSRKRHKKDMGFGTKPVLWLSDDNTEIIQEFYSVNSVCDTLDISAQTVSNICNHKITNPRFNLIFKSEYMEEQRLSEKGYIAEAV